MPTFAYYQYGGVRGEGGKDELRVSPLSADVEEFAPDSARAVDFFCFEGEISQGKNAKKFIVLAIVHTFYSFPPLASFISL